MPLDAEGTYYAPVSPKQNKGRDLARNYRFVLFNGTRFSTKTFAGTSCVADHAWEVKDANIAIITISLGTGSDSGVWIDLIRILTERIRCNFGMKWIKEPWIDSVSKKPTCIVLNSHGQPVQIQLWSCQDENQVEAKFKGPRFTMIYVPELSVFKWEKTFNTWCECLRIPGELGMTREEKEALEIPDNHLFLADTNPADEGEDSWIYKLWFVLLNATDEEVEADPDLRSKAAHRRNMARLDFTVDDNIFDSKERLEILKSTYAHDQDMYNRYWLGMWVRASSDAIFNANFSPQRHVIGEAETTANSNPLILWPQESCFELLTGWDLGTRNCAFEILEKHPVTIVRMVKTKDGKLEEREFTVPAFKALDELVVLETDFILEEFVDKVVEKLDYWEGVMNGRVSWTHWSDRNVFEVRSLDGRLHLNQAINLASYGRIVLKGAWDAQRAAMNKRSIDNRIDLTRKLLFENRILISRLCPNLIEMFKSMTRGKNQSSGIAPGSKFKHAFDAASYVWCSECYEEMAQAVVNNLRHKHEKPVGAVQIAYAAGM